MPVERPLAARDSVLQSAPKAAAETALLVEPPAAR